MCGSPADRGARPAVTARFNRQGRKGEAGPSGLMLAPSPVPINAVRRTVIRETVRVANSFTDERWPT